MPPPPLNPSRTPCSSILGMCLREQPACLGGSNFQQPAQKFILQSNEAMPWGVAGSGHTGDTILQTRAATVLVGGCCRRGSRNPPYGGSFVELSAWPSLCEAGELGSCYWMMRRFHGMARCVHLTAALLQAVYRSCLFASVEHIFHWLPLVHFYA